MATSFEMTDDGGIRVRRGAASISRFEAEEVAELRALLGIPGLTPEEVEVALAERVLEDAKCDDILHSCGWDYDIHGKFIYFLFPTNGDRSQHPATTRLSAAQAAVARVRELRAEKERAEAKKLPDVGSMAVGEMIAELHGLGWSEGYSPNGWPCWNGPHTQYPEGGGTNWTGTTRCALRRARELDGAK